MNDRFKFRVWNGSEMHHNDFIVTATGYVGRIIEEFLGQCVFKQDDLTADNECILMQCTGMKDKNGKLIFEGDIVRVGNSVFEIANEIGCFMLATKTNNEAIHSFPNSWNDNVYPLAQLYFEYENEENFISQLEVIGNIYENTELLKECE